jgi:hypothetical protein
MRQLHLKRDILITSKYTTGNGRNFKKISANHFSFTPERDPEKVKGRDYGGLIHHFSFRVGNLRRTTRVIRIDVTGINHPYGPDACVWVKRGKSWRYADKVDCEVDWKWTYKKEGSRKVINWQGTKTALSFRVKLLPGEEVEVSEAFNFSHDEIMDFLHQTVRRFNHLVKLTDIGETHEGRTIPCLRIGMGRPHATFMIEATPQASEIGALACMAAIKELCSSSRWSKAARRKFVYYVLPCTNPDGVDRGHCMVNALGENPIFEGRAAFDGKKVSKEAKAVAGFAGKLKPDVYLGYHSHYQSHMFMTSLKPWGLYMFDRLLMKSPKKQKAADVVTSRLTDLDFGFYSYNRLGGYFSDTLPHVLQEKHQTLSYWLKLYTRADVETNEKKAIEVLRTIVNNYRV